MAASSLPYGSGWPSRPPRPAGSPQLNPWVSSADCRTRSARPCASSRRLERPARQKSPRQAGWLLADGEGRLLPRRRRQASRRKWPKAWSRLLLLLLPRRRLPKPPPPDRGRRRRSPPGRQGTRGPAPRCRLVDGGGDSDQSRLVRSHKTNSARKKTIQRKKGQLTTGGGLAREYGSLPNRQSSRSLLSER